MTNQEKLIIETLIKLISENEILDLEIVAKDLNIEILELKKYIGVDDNLGELLSTTLGMEIFQEYMIKTQGMSIAFKND